jgi:hypothetical protein
VPERGQYPTFDDADGIFHLGFIARFVRPGGQDRDAVMLRHLVIGAVEIRLIAAGPRDSRAWVVRHEQLGDALEKLEGAHMAVDPVRQVLAERRTRKGVGAGAEHGYEDRGRRDFAALAVVDRNGVAGPVDEGLVAGVVILPEHHITVAMPPLIEFAEAAVAVAVRLRFTVLLPEELQRQMFVSLQLGMQLGEIQTRPRLRRGPQWPFRKKQFVQAPVVEILRQRPGHFGGCGLLQIPVNGRLAYRTTAGDLVLLQAQAKT